MSTKMIFGFNSWIFTNGYTFWSGKVFEGVHYHVMNFENAIKIQILF